MDKLILSSDYKQIPETKEIIGFLKKTEDSYYFIMALLNQEK
nr:hypothetical protein [Enterococcus faecium]